MVPYLALDTGREPVVHRAGNSYAVIFFLNGSDDAELAWQAVYNDLAVSTDVRAEARGDVNCPTIRVLIDGGDNLGESLEPALALISKANDQHETRENKFRVVNWQVSEWWRQRRFWR